MSKDSGHFKIKFYKGNNSGNETYKVRIFRKFSQQTGVDIYLEPKKEEFKGKCNFFVMCMGTIKQIARNIRLG